MQTEDRGRRDVNSVQTGCPVRPVPLAQIAPGDFDIAVVGQLAATNRPFGDEFERGLVKMVSFEAPFRRGGLRKQNLEYPSGNSHIALIVADPDTG